jgi:putative membrane protein insertion efficiency factor
MRSSSDRDRLIPVGSRIVISVLRLYQSWLSPVKPPTCRYYPSCSEYAVRAIAARGVLRGSLLAAWRLLRCNPFSPGGYDPVPQDPTDSRQERD